jgi:hypothetical protein
VENNSTTPSWEGSFRVIKVMSSNAYFMETLEGARKHRCQKP